MPDANGRFRGISIPSDAWTRVFGPALADDPAYEHDDDRMRDCPAGHGRCPCLPGSTSEAYCHAELAVPRERARETRQRWATDEEIRKLKW
jgi:hypothetical protein